MFNVDYPWYDVHDDIDPEVEDHFDSLEFDSPEEQDEYDSAHLDD